jgi:hypothetical protein
MNGLDKIEEWLDQIPFVVPALAEGNMQGAVTSLMQTAEDLPLFDNRSGATRASTIAYLAGSAGESGGFGAAAGAGEALIEAWIAQNPTRARGVDRVEIEMIEPEGPADATHVILTALMRYDEWLFTMQGGSRNVLGESLEIHQVDLAEAGWAGIAELFK